jgi:hypothetical protein
LPDERVLQRVLSRGQIGRIRVVFDLIDSIVINEPQFERTRRQVKHFDGGALPFPLEPPQHADILGACEEITTLDPRAGDRRITHIPPQSDPAGG